MNGVPGRPQLVGARRQGPNRQRRARHQFQAGTTRDAGGTRSLGPHLEIALVSEGLQDDLGVHGVPKVVDLDGRDRLDLHGLGLELAGMEPFDLDLRQAPVVAGPDAEGQVEATPGQGPVGAVPPEDGLGAVSGILNRDAAMLSCAADGCLAQGPQVADGKGQRRVAGTKGRQPVHVGHQVQRQVRQLYVGIDGQGRLGQVPVLCSHGPRQGSAKLGDLIAFEGKTRCARVAAVGCQQVGTVIQGRDQVYAGDRSARTPGQLALGRVDEDGRLVESFCQPSGDDAHDASGPGGMAEHQGVVLAQEGRITLDLIQRGGRDLLGQPLALGVEALQLGGQGAGAGGIGGGQELDAVGGIGEAAQGVQPGGQNKADVLLGEALGSDAGRMVQGQQSGTLRAAEPLQTALYQVAVVTGEGAHVTHGAQGDEIQGLVGGRRIQGQGQLVGDTHAGERAQRMPGRQETGIDDGQGRWELGAGDVVVGDDDVSAHPVGQGGGVVGGDACIAGEDHASAVVDEALEVLFVQAVALLPGGEAKNDVHVQGAQRLQQEGCGRLPVGVKIPHDGDPFPFLRCPA